MNLEDFHALLGPRGQEALAAASELVGEDPVRAATRLRRTYDAGLTSAALTQAGLRVRARAKFPAEDAERMYFTPHGLEQSTRHEVATHRATRLTGANPHDPARPSDVDPHDPARAARLDPRDTTRTGRVGPHDPARAAHRDPRDTAQAGHVGSHDATRTGHVDPRDPTQAGHLGPHDATRAARFDPRLDGPGMEGDVSRQGFGGGRVAVVDACCGIGGDSLALARAGCVVTAVDADPLTAAVAAANAEALGLSGSITVRVGDAADVVPEEFDALFADPARRTGKGRTFDPMAYSPPWPVVLDLVRRAEAACLKVAPGIPYEFIPDGAEAEWVSYRGEVKEAALWIGHGDGGRRATLLPGGQTLVARGVEASVGPLGRYVYEPDGAAVRAHLVGEVAEIVGGRLADPMIAYVTADEAVDTPWASRYEVDEALPFSLKKLRAALRSREIGNVTIKKRGSAVDIERLRADLRLSGDKSAVIILTRIMDRPYALICHPSPPA